ncbi:MAG: Ig-like domain repeat protein, partial [Elusimicrobia bacterium]|nr:Ig-like domain repeat protein [Elusimicrobiota bacterium]
ESKVWDKAGNDVVDIATFTYDISHPTSTITTPVADTHYNKDSFPANFTGTSTDTVPGEPASVVVALQNTTQNPDQYWTGSGWVGAITWSNESVDFTNPTGASSWQWATSINWKNPVDDERHIFYAKAIDKASNEEVIVSTKAFFFQGNMPEVVLTTPKEGSYYNYEANGLISIAGTADYSDDVDVKLQRFTDYQGWDQSAGLWESSTTFMWNNKVVAGGGAPWSMSIDTDAWTDGINYKVTARGHSDDMGYEPGYELDNDNFKNFIMDLTDPAVMVTVPTDGSYTNSIAQVAGTATDSPGAGIRSAELYLQRTSDNYYWDIYQSTWVSGIIWSTSSYSDPDWSLANNPAWEHAVTYKAAARAYDDINDGAGSFNSKISAEISFTYDIVAPTSAIISPADGSYPSVVNSIDGTSADEFSIDKVMLQIKNEDTTTWWKPSGGWSTSEQWVVADGTDNWTFSGITDTNYDNDTDYLLKAKAIDVAGSTSTVVSLNFTYDNQEPYSEITIPASGYIADLTAIGGNASDYNVSGVSAGAVKNHLQDLTNGSKYWDGGSWVVFVSTLETSGLWDNNYILPKFSNGTLLSAHEYRITSWVSGDNATPPNIESNPATFDVVVDSVTPLSRVTYPADGDNIKAISSLSGTAYDDWSSVNDDWANYPLDLEIVALANGADWGKDEYWTGTVWSTNTATVQHSVFVSSWSYTFGAAMDSGREYKVTPTIQDMVPNDQAPVDISSVTFLYDNETPDAAVVSPSGNINYAPSTIEGTTADNPVGTKKNSGVVSAELKIKDLTEGTSFWDGDSWTGTEDFFAIASSTFYYQVPSPTATFTDGHTYQLSVRATDNAGNSYVSPTVNFTYDITDPVTYMDIPGNGDYYSYGYPDEISGSAEDTLPGSDVSKVKIVIKRQDGQWWWDSDKSWHVALDGEEWIDANYNGISDDWSYSVPYPTSTWSDGVKYYAYSNVLDKAGNYEAGDGSYGIPVSSHTFITDATPPTVGAIYPITDTNTQDDITGTAADSAPGEINTVKLHIWRAIGSWDGVNDVWDADNVHWNTASINGSTWTYNDVNMWANEVTYKYVAKVTDRAGNTVEASTQTFMYDATSPNSLVQVPVNTKFYSSLTELSGTSDDGIGTGPTSVKIRIADLTVSPTVYWNGENGWDTNKDVDWWNCNPPATGWTYDFIDTFWTDGHKYNVQTKAKDNAGNWETPSAGGEFTYDSVSPTSTVTQPRKTKSYNSLTTISGSSSDGVSGINPAGIDYVEVRIKRFSDGYTWKESITDWVGSDWWDKAFDSTSWTFTVSDSAWSGLSGSSFAVNSRAYDKTDYSFNYEVEYSTNIFWIDNIEPTSVLTQPEFTDLSVGTPFYSNIASIIGTAGDDIGVLKTEINIKKYDGSDFVWNGSTWVSNTKYWLQSGAEDVSPWTYNMTGGTSPWTSGERYMVNSRATDTCDYNPNYEIGYSTHYFIFDNVIPESVVEVPQNDTGYNNLPQISGTGDDSMSGTYPAKVLKVEIALQKDPNNLKGWDDSTKWWDGVAESTDSFTSLTPVWKEVIWYPATQDWDIDISSTLWNSGLQYLVRSRATDKVPTSPNYETNFSAGVNESEFSIDNVAPETFFIKPADGASYNDSTNKVTKIYGTSSDDASGVKVASITIQNITTTDYWNGFGWVGSAAPLTCELSSNGTAWWYNDVPVWPSGNEFRVYAWGMDKTGNIETQHDPIFTVDSESPTSEVTYPSDNGFTNYTKKIEGTCADDFSGVDDTAVYINLIDLTNPDTYYYFDGASWIIGQTWLSVTVSTPNWWYEKGTESSFNWKNGHRYIILPRAKDLAQNQQTVFSTSSFIYDRNADDGLGIDGEPNSSVTVPGENDYLQGLSLVEGTSEDRPQGTFEGAVLSSAGIQQVEVRIRDLIDGGNDKWWTGTVWSTDTIKFNNVSSGKEDWDYSSPPWTTNHKYQINVRAIDNVPNEEISVTTRTFTIDRSSPTAGVTIPADGIDKATRPSAISGTSEDDDAFPATYKATVDKVWVEVNDVDTGKYWNGSTWTTQNWMTTDNGEPNWTVNIDTNCWTDTHQYSLKSKVSDKAGNLTQSSLNTFYYDETPPLSFM